MKAQLFEVKIPMQRAFGHSVKARLSSESLILLIQHEGIIGLGECAPRNYVTGETLDSVSKEIYSISLKQIFNAIDFSRLDLSMQGFIDYFSSAEVDHLSLNTKCLIEMAVFDYIGKKFQKTVNQLIAQYCLPEGLKQKNTSRQFPITQTFDFSLSAEAFLRTRAPFHYVKIKIGKNLGDDLQRVKQVRRALGSKVPICLDVNMNWSLSEAMDYMHFFEPLDIAFYEEPLPRGSYEAYQVLRQNTQEKILLDESLCSIEDAHRAINFNACDAFNIRIAKCGGLLNAIQMIKLACQYNLAFQIGAQVAEVGPLISAGRHLISAVNGPFTFEAGQADRFFDAQHFPVAPMPSINRQSNTISPHPGDGLGIQLSQNFNKHAKLLSEYSSQKWQQKEKEVML